jgi:hypothetical protein
MKERIGRLDYHKVGGSSPQRAAVDAVARGKARGAAADLVDDADEVGSEAGRHGDAELRRRLGHRGQEPVHRVQPGGRHPDADFTRAGVRLRNLAQTSGLS